MKSVSTAVAIRNTIELERTLTGTVKDAEEILVFGVKNHLEII
jgi:hypothetical protein